MQFYHTKKGRCHIPPISPPDPGVVAAFIASLAAVAWTSGVRFKIVRHNGWPEGEWALSTTTGFAPDEATFNAIKGGTAGTDASGAEDGSVWCGGVRYWLRDLPSTMTVLLVAA